MKIKQLFLLLLVLLSAIHTRAYQLEDSLTTITINATAGLQFDLVRFAARPGEKIRLSFTNNTDMSHNLLITQPGAREQVVNAALQLAEKGPELDYIPETPQVLWAIPVISPGEAKSITFTAPKEPGAYPYVCTFPGHGYIMYGVMYVSVKKDMPEMEGDLNIPEHRRKTGSDGKNATHAAHRAEPSHPYKLTPPYLYRAYVEEAGPAAIAVRLPDELAYCWDAGTCRLQFAWQGEFVDNTGIWKGKPNAVAKVLGTVFFEDKTPYPLGVGDADRVPATAYLGYRLIDKYPEFFYRVNGTLVHELIQGKEGGGGLIRTFRIPEASGTVWFYADARNGVVYEASAGKWEGDKLRLSSEEAKKFTITMTKKGTK